MIFIFNILLILIIIIIFFLILIIILNFSLCNNRANYSFHNCEK